jgi:hypothetical protein
VSHESNQASAYPTKEDQTKAHGGRRGSGHGRSIGRVQFEFQAHLERDDRVNELEFFRHHRYPGDHRSAFSNAQFEWQDLLGSRRVDWR